MTFKQMLAAIALVCAATAGTSTVALAEAVVTENDGASADVGPVVLYVTDIPDDDPDGGLIVRSGPSTRTREVDVLENGTAVTTIEWPVTGFFVEITEPVTGWVGVKYLTLDKPVQPIRQIDAQNARPAIDTSDDGSDQSEPAPESLALDDESDDGADASVDTDGAAEDGGFPFLPVALGAVLLATAAGAMSYKRRDAAGHEDPESDSAVDDERPKFSGETVPDLRATELAERAARVQRNRPVDSSPDVEGRQ